MAGHKKEKLLLKGPIYPGGQKAMLLFIQNNLCYPTEAIESKVEGTVRIRFSIDHQGKVFKSQVIGGIGHGCDEEAQRLVGLLVFIVPKVYKLRVEYHRTLNIHFKLPAQHSGQVDTPSPNPLTFQYNIISTMSTQTVEASKESEGSYHYTIQIKS